MTVPPLGWVLAATSYVLLGVLLLRRLRVRVVGVEAFAWGTALGTGAASLWIFALVASGAWAALAPAPSARTAAVLAPGLVLAVLDALARRRATPTPPGPRTRAFDPYLVPPALVAAVLALAALAPDTGFDALVYHLPAAARVGRDGLGAMPGCFDGELRLGFDLLVVPWLRLDGAVPRGPAFLHALAGVALAAGVFAETRRRAGPAAAAVVSTLLLLSPEVVRLATTAYVDLAVGLYGFVALAAAARALRDEPGPHAALAGVFAGFAANAKLNALLVVGLVALAFLVGRPRGARLRPMAVAVASGALVALPWFARAAWNTGNPCFPLFADTLGTGWATPASVRLATQTVLEQTGLPRDAGLGLRGLLHGVFDPAWAFQTPAFVVALAPAAARRLDTPERRGLVVAGLASAVAWAWFVPLARFGFAPLAWGAVAAGVGGARLVARRRLLARGAALVALGLAALDARAARGLPPRVRATWIGDTAPAYVADDLGRARGAARAAAGERRPGLASHALALVGPDAVSLTPQRNGVLTQSDLDDPAAYLRGCRRLGLTALVVPEGHEAYDQLIDALLASGDVARVSREVRGWKVVRLRPAPR